MSYISLSFLYLSLYLLVSLNVFEMDPSVFPIIPLVWFIYWLSEPLTRPDVITELQEDPWSESSVGLITTGWRSWYLKTWRFNTSTDSVYGAIHYYWRVKHFLNDSESEIKLNDSNLLNAVNIWQPKKVGTHFWQNSLFSGVSSLYFLRACPLILKFSNRNAVTILVLTVSCLILLIT